MNTIMLIDDDPTMLKLLRTLLEIEGFKPAVWTGSEDIIDETRKHQPEMILLDVNLRGINGIDILKEIRKDAKMMQTPVIMTSGIDMRKECIQAGASDFIVKPYMPNDLIRAIRAALPEGTNHGA